MNNMLVGKFASLGKLTYSAKAARKLLSTLHADFFSQQTSTKESSSPFGLNENFEKCRELTKIMQAKKGVPRSCQGNSAGVQ